MQAMLRSDNGLPGGQTGMLNSHVPVQGKQPPYYLPQSVSAETLGAQQMPRHGCPQNALATICTMLTKVKGSPAMGFNSTSGGEKGGKGGAGEHTALICGSVQGLTEPG